MRRKESSRYFSWERYFADLLTRQTQGTYLHYKKSSLNPAYLTDPVRKGILAVMEQISFLANREKKKDFEVSWNL